MIRLVLAVPLLTLLVACGGAPETKASGPHTQVVLSLQEISCQSCGVRSVAALQDVSGVQTATFDRDSAELTVLYDPAMTNEKALSQTVRNLGFGVALGAGKGGYTKTVEFPDSVDMAWISQGGEVVELDDHVVDDKVTVFDFSATWCGPCKVVDREMLSILELKQDVALRKLNVTDWDSPVAKKYLAEVPSLPYVIVYGMQGKQVRAISGLDLKALHAAIEEGRKQ